MMYTYRTAQLVSFIKSDRSECRYSYYLSFTSSQQNKYEANMFLFSQQILLTQTLEQHGSSPS